MKLPLTILLFAAVMVAACTGEVPPPSCNGENLRPVNAGISAGAQPQISALTERLSHQNCAAPSAALPFAGAEP